MHYYIAIELPKSQREAYGVVVPDIPGCFSAGDTFDEAITNAEEAILIQLEDIVERGKSLPKASSLDEIAAMKGYKSPRNWILSGVNIDLQQLSKKAVRVNITIPEGALYMIDRAAEESHQNRSAFLTEAALQMIKD